MNEPPKTTLNNPLFRGDGKSRPPTVFPPAPPWRAFKAESWIERGAQHCASAAEVDAINLALHLHRPLLITGRPGSGKTSLAYAAANELGLDRPLVWPINSRSTLAQGLYQYDAVGRLKDANLSGRQNADDQSLGQYLRLNPLGAALALSQPQRPAVLLIDEIDKGDVDLPNDLLHVFEEGQFEIPELSRIQQRSPIVEVGMPNSLPPFKVPSGIVQCQSFPLVLMTSNGERDFPPAFLRRCIRLNIEPPKQEELLRIIAARLAPKNIPTDVLRAFVARFVATRDDGSRKELATDQLLNAVQLIDKGVLEADFQKLIDLQVLADLSA